MSVEDLFDTKPGSQANRVVGPGRFPKWLHRQLPKGKELFKTRSLLAKNRLSLVCEEARCPNQQECYAKRTATFLALGSSCTRACGFCDIEHSKAPPPPDPTEPARIAQTSKKLGLKHIVITMVTRDDLPDGGAQALANIMREIRKTIPSATIEVLTSDFGGNRDALDIVLKEKPEIFNHNIETTRALTSKVRHIATYDRSLEVLTRAHASGQCRAIKSGIMVGLGELEVDVKEAIADLKTAGCSIVTIGQYLQADRNKLRVKAYIHPDQFKAYEEHGISLGIKHMYCSPFVRSSYNAEAILRNL